MDSMRTVIADIETSITCHLNLRYTKLCGSGTEGFINILNILNLQKDDEILIPNFICEILMTPILVNNVKYKLVDVQNGKFLPSLEEYKKQFTKRTKVILIAYLWGYVHEDLDSIIKWAKANNLIIIEDIASSYNLSYHGKKLGSLGDYTFGSFGNGKLIDVGKFGFIASNNYISDFPLMKNNTKIDYVYIIKKIRKVKPKFIRKYLFKKLLKEYDLYLSVNYDFDTLKILLDKLSSINQVYCVRKENVSKFLSALAYVKNVYCMVPNNDQHISNRIACWTDNLTILKMLKKNNCWVGTDFRFPLNYFVSGFKLDNTSLISKKIFNLLTNENNTTIDLTIDIIEKGGVLNESKKNS